MICRAMLKPAMSLYLCEMVLLGICTVAFQTVREVIIAFPPVRPLRHGHNLVSVPNRRINFDRLSSLHMCMRIH